MTFSPARPSAPLTWLRLRLRVKGPTAARVLAGARVRAELLPVTPVAGLPLHRLLATWGALLSVSADGHGVVAHVVTDTDRAQDVVDALAAARSALAPAELVEHAREQAALAWRWERDDSEALADLLADLALHTPPSSWPDLHDDLVDAMAADDPGEWSGEVTIAHVGPPGGSISLPEPVAQDRNGQSTVESAEPARWRLDVVSDGSALVRMAWRTPRRDHPDFAALAVAARVVGGHHRSRLTREFRNDRGWSYSPWALARAGRDHGWWQVSVRVPERHVAETVDRVRELVGGHAPDPAEHGAAVAHAATEIRRLWSSGESAASLLGYWQDLGLDVAAEKDRWLSALAATTPEDVTAAARRWLSGPPQLEVVLA
ncbi:insulinase family protein [Actinosynnema sp. NPDC091369]